MKNYEKPIVNVLDFTADDVITNSPLKENEDSWGDFYDTLVTNEKVG